jgi:hypothetical protein
MDLGENQSESTLKARRRLVWFGLHLVGYFIVMAGLFFVFLPGENDPARMAIVLVGWGSVLALHAAFVMGLFKVFSKHED